MVKCQIYQFFLVAGTVKVVGPSWAGEENIKKPLYIVCPKMFCNTRTDIASMVVHLKTVHYETLWFCFQKGCKAYFYKAQELSKHLREVILISWGMDELVWVFGSLGLSPVCSKLISLSISSVHHHDEYKDNFDLMRNKYTELGTKK